MDFKRIIKELFQTLTTDFNRPDYNHTYDVLGAYYYSGTHIEIYYIPILLYAYINNLAPGDLFVVVLANEYSTLIIMLAKTLTKNNGIKCPMKYLNKRIACPILH